MIMKINSFRKAVSSVALFVCLVSVSTLGNADPYFITYTGTITSSTFPEVTDTQVYTATLVFDNGGTSALTQTWEAAELTCAIFTANDAQDVQFVHDLTSQAPTGVDGSASTDAGANRGQPPSRRRA